MHDNNVSTVNHYYETYSDEQTLKHVFCPKTNRLELILG